MPYATLSTLPISPHTVTVTMTTCLCCHNTPWTCKGMCWCKQVAWRSWAGLTLLHVRARRRERGMVHRGITHFASKWGPQSACT